MSRESEQLLIDFQNWIHHTMTLAAKFARCVDDPDRLYTGAQRYLLHVTDTGDDECMDRLLNARAVLGIGLSMLAQIPFQSDEPSKEEDVLSMRLNARRKCLKRSIMRVERAECSRRGSKLNVQS